MAASDHRADAVPAGRCLPADARPPADAARRPADRLDRPAGPRHGRRARRRPDRDGARPAQRPREADLDVLGPVHRRRPRHRRPGHGGPACRHLHRRRPDGPVLVAAATHRARPEDHRLRLAQQNPLPITLAAETNGGRSARWRLVRLQVANGVQRRPLREHGLVGALSTTTARHPVLPCWCLAAPRAACTRARRRCSPPTARRPWPWPEPPMARSGARPGPTGSTCRTQLGRLRRPLAALSTRVVDSRDGRPRVGTTDRGVDTVRPADGRLGHRPLPRRSRPAARVASPPWPRTCRTVTIHRPPLASSRITIACARLPRRTTATASASSAEWFWQ
jgi:hypothetical protein